MAQAVASASRRSFLLAAGSAASGLLAFVFFATVTHAVGAGAAAPFAILWAFWAYASAGITFPLQHWAIRSVTATGGEMEVRRSLPVLLAATGGVALVAWVITFVLREPLFGAQGDAFALMTGLTAVGAAVAGVVRGVLTARERFGAVAVAMALENGARVVIALALALDGVHSIVPYGLALLGGYAASVVWPSAWRLGRTGEDHRASPLTFLASASSGQLMGHVVLTSGPVLLTLGGGEPAAVTSLFAALALFRAPYLLMLGAVAGLTGRLTHAAVTRDHKPLVTFRRLIVAVAVVLALLAAVVGALAGPWVLSVIYGSGVTLSHTLAGIVAAGCVLAMANLLVIVLLISLNRASRAFPAWLVACVPGVLALVPGVLPGHPSLLLRVCLAFLIVEVGALVALLSTTVRPLRLLR